MISIIDRFIGNAIQKSQALINATKDVGFRNQTLFGFQSEDIVKKWLTSDDTSFGGQSSCSFTYQPVEKYQNSDYIPCNGAAIFSGETSLYLKPTSADIVRTGYCAIRGDIPIHVRLIGSNAICMRVKSDGRTYRVNAQTDSWNPHDLYVGYLQTPPNEWVDVELKYEDFLLTSKGFVKDLHEDPDNRTILNPRKLRKIGFILADQQEGPFELHIEWIKAIKQDQVKEMPMEENKQ